MSTPGKPTSTRPYLLRAVYEWCVDNGYTPQIAVTVDTRTRVPLEYVRNGEIVLNIGPEATSRLKIGNDTIECSARFSGVAKELVIPVAAVTAIYARETGQGMAFEPEKPADADAVSEPATAPGPKGPQRPAAKPALKRIK